MNVVLGKWSTISAVPLSAAALLFAAPASADQTDDAFIAALQKHGITFTTRDAAINTGHSMCAGLDKGQAATNLVLSIVKDTNLTPREAGYVLGASVTSYCPQHMGVIGNSVS